MSQLRGTLLLAAYTTLTALGFLLVGYDIGVLGGVIVSRSFRESFNHPSASLLGTIVASFEIGALFGSISAVIFGEQLGRTRSTTVGALVVLVGAVFQAASQNVRMLIVARVVCGLGVGIVNSTVPVLQAEISPKATRGLFVCIQLTVLNLGTMLAYWVGYGFTSSKQITGSAQWRIPLALQIVFVIPLLALSHFVVPESPRWLAAHGRIPEAREVLEQLHYDSATAEPGAGGGDAEVDSIITSITDTVKFDEQFGSGRWADIWRLLGREDTVKSRKRLLIACAIQAFQQLGGINGG
ncbi:hypothetical protein FRC09_008664 [Ceratobasidium sp. 395]|nr:hypothetical protein FRC09_008664 [Ceratobasidium sp. 395]